MNAAVLPVPFFARAMILFPEKGLIYLELWGYLLVQVEYTLLRWVMACQIHERQFPS